MSDKFDAEHTAAAHCVNAGKYFAMAWAANGAVWARIGHGELVSAATALGYRLVKIEDAPASPGDRMRVEHVGEDDR